MTALRAWSYVLALSSLQPIVGCTESKPLPSSPGAETSSTTVSSRVATAASPTGSAAAAHPTGPPLSCALGLSSTGKDRFALSVIVENRTPKAKVARYYHPLMFALEARAGSKQIEVQIPPFDGPVEPRTAAVPAGERVEIETPVTIRFAPDGQPPSDSPFDWLLITAPTALWLRARRALSDPPDLSCELKWSPR